MVTVADSGLYIGNKLACEHVYLTSYSRMNVRLAAQVNIMYACMHSIAVDYFVRCSVVLLLMVLRP